LTFWRIVKVHVFISCLYPFAFLFFWGISDPDKQFKYLQNHIEMLRADPVHRISPIFIFVERNLGFEAEHHKRALDHLPNVQFYVDVKANRVGVLTTESVKHAMCSLLNCMLAEKRMHVCDPLVSSDPKAMRVKLREQMATYSYQVKLALNTFQKDRIALSGKVGGLKDDICICLQLACYFTQVEEQRAQEQFSLSK
jgi:putative ubiquitin-RnfH superfamily antitoxin RatB of RatAB toxin-antitoxin module